MKPALSAHSATPPLGRRVQRRSRNGGRARILLSDAPRALAEDVTSATCKCVIECSMNAVDGAPRIHTRAHARMLKARHPAPSLLKFELCPRAPIASI